MDIEKLLINNNIIKQIENDHALSPIIPIIDKKEKEKQDMINMLKNILRLKFESKLSTLEKNSKNHFSIINNTLSTTKQITELSIKMNKILAEKQEKKLKEKRNNFSKTYKSTKKLNFTQNYLYTSRTSKNSTTPLRTTTSRGIFKSVNHSLIKRMKNGKEEKNKSLYRLKTSGGVFDSTSKRPFSSRGNKLNSFLKEKNNNNNSSPIKNNIYKKNISSNINKNKKFNIRINSNLEELSKQSIMSNDTQNTNLTSRSSKPTFFFHKNKSRKRNSIASNRKSPRKNVGLIKKMKKALDKSIDRNSILSGRNVLKSNIKDDKIKKNLNNTEFDKINKNSFKLDKNILSNIKLNPVGNSTSSINEAKMISLENNLKKDLNMINIDDPLLISSLKDLDLSKDDINKNNLFSLSPKNGEKIISFKNIFVDHLNNFIVFLSTKDILELKNCSKSFHNLIVEYFDKMFNSERNIFIEKQNKLNLSVDEIPKKLSINDFNLSKGALKAIDLLNEEIINRLFFEEITPNSEIFIVYKIYFQLIKNQEIIQYFNESIFWEKCKSYFNSYKGKTGDCLNEIYTQKKIFIDGDNIYKVYKIIQNNINKILPAYYSKICGTTGIFVFFVKDILDFLGFSNDKNIQKNSYWSYSEIINSIDSKINMLNKFKKY
jgi:hypothetical protein